MHELPEPPGSVTTSPPRTAELIELLTAQPWFLHVARTAARVDVPDGWIGAGAVRDLVWDVKFGGGFDPRHIKDVDFVFFDARDHTRAHDAAVEAELHRLEPSVRWDAKNQAAVHEWYPQRFGLHVAPLRSTLEGVATWPEYATCVAVRWNGDALDVAAPYGLDDLLDGVYRINPVRVTVAEYERRLAAKDPARRWPAVRVQTPAS